MPNVQCGINSMINDDVVVAEYRERLDIRQANLMRATQVWTLGAFGFLPNPQNGPDAAG